VNEWSDKAAMAAERKQRLLSFGVNAEGVLINTKWGLFVGDPEDNSVTRVLLDHGVYGEDEITLASYFIRPDGEVLIVGTHIGAIAIPLSKRCRRMDVIEANPSTQRLLRANLLLNRCDNVTLHPFAAGEAEGQIDFLLSRDCSGGSKRRPLQNRFYYDYDQPEVVQVPVFALDAALPFARYDLVFMDIEGSEYFALKGMQRILTHASALAVEFLPFHFVDVAGVGPDDFTDQILPHFEWMYLPSGDRLVPKARIRSYIKEMFDRGEGHDNIYFLKQADPAWASGRIMVD
jgi:FkbM family methyltransferase